MEKTIQETLRDKQAELIELEKKRRLLKDQIHVLESIFNEDKGQESRKDSAKIKGKKRVERLDIVSRYISLVLYLLGKPGQEIHINYIAKAFDLNEKTFGNWVWDRIKKDPDCLFATGTIKSKIMIRDDLTDAQKKKFNRMLSYQKRREAITHILDQNSLKEMHYKDIADQLRVQFNIDVKYDTLDKWMKKQTKLYGNSCSWIFSRNKAYYKLRSNYLVNQDPTIDKISWKPLVKDQYAQTSDSRHYRQTKYRQIDLIQSDGWPAQSDR